jgi:hypothetical protein
MFQGSELSVETTGAAFVPILNALDYNLFLPGNWEVIWEEENANTVRLTKCTKKYVQICTTI